MSDTKPMSHARKLELEGALLSVRSRYNHISVRALQNAPAGTYQFIKVFLDGENIRLMMVDERGENPALHSIMLDAVVASTMAVDILELAQRLFPDDIDIKAERLTSAERQS